MSITVHNPHTCRGCGTFSECACFSHLSGLERIAARGRLPWRTITGDNTNAKLSGLNASHCRWDRAHGIDGGALLEGADLSGANLSEGWLRDADLRGADLRGASLRHCRLTGADLSGADLTGADLTGADLRGADLRGADLSGAIVAKIWIDKGTRFPSGYAEGSSVLRRCRRDEAISADLRGVVIAPEDLLGLRLRCADLRGAVFHGTFGAATLNDCDLSGADLSGADVGALSFERCSLRGANLRDANLAGARMTRVDLRGADLSGANLRGALLDGADLSTATVSPGALDDAYTADHAVYGESGFGSGGALLHPYVHVVTKLPEAACA